MRTIASFLLTLTYFSAGVAQEPIRFPPSPRLAISADELKRLPERSDFATQRDLHLKQGERWLKNPVVIPKGWGNWSFYYACPEDGSHLTAISPTEHRCPRCKKVLTDERTVAAYRTLQHDQANIAALQLAWAYAYSGDDRFAQEVSRILLQYADDYRTYPTRADRWGRTGFLAFLGGRRYSQSLDESVGIIKLAKAYDLTRSARCWTDAQRKHVENDFFRETAKTLLTYNQGINNHQTWYNAGLMSIASILGDEALVKKVLAMPGGFRDQLQRSLGDDGYWYEGTMAYHNYALQAMIEIVDAGRRLGLPLHEERRFRKMIDLPMECAYPNGQFPAMNDSDRAHLSNFGHAFLWAWRTYGDRKYAQAYANGNLPRLKELLGAEAKVEAFMPTQSQVLKDIGLAILRRGQGSDAVCVMLDYGPHGGSHGHFDKLNIVLYANGREWLLDPGRLSYSHKEYQTWVKHTAAHNTVTLGGRSQAATTGKLISFDADDKRATCIAESDGAYPGSKLRRQLILTEKTLVDIFEVETAKETQIDYLLHAISQKVEPLTAVPDAKPGAAGDFDGYPHLKQVRAWPNLGPSQWTFEATKTLKLGVAFEGFAKEEILACEGIGYQVDARVPCLIRRVQGTKARFVTIFDLTGSGTLDRTKLPGQ